MLVQQPLAGGGDGFQVVGSSKNDAAVDLSALWSSLSPPEAPNIRPSLAPLNCHTSILHMLTPFPGRLKQGDIVTGVINLPGLMASKARLNATLRRQHSRFQESPQLRSRGSLGLIYVRNGLANSRVSQPVLGINELRSDDALLWSYDPVRQSLGASAQ